jgi:hypothetical protein
MADRLAGLRIVDPTLTNLARGYTNDDHVGEALFPVAYTDKEAGKIPQWGKESFKIYKTERALRAKSNRIMPEGTTPINFVCEEHDLEYPVDYREGQESMLPLELHATRTVTDVIDLRREKMCADFCQNPDTFPEGNKVTLSGTDQFTDYDNSDPLAVFEEGKEAIRAKIGRYPNTMVLGALTYKVLKHHPKLIELIKYSMKGIVTVDLLQELTDIPDVRVGRAIYADDDDNFHDLWSDVAVMAYVPKNRGENGTPYEPSFAYTLRKRGNPLVDKYDEAKKLLLIRNTDIFVPKVVGAEAGYLIQDTNG